MSYTPEDQLLEEPITNVIKSIDELKDPIKQRIRNPDGWDRKHLEELLTLTDKLTRLQFELTILKTHVR